MIIKKIVQALLQGVVTLCILLAPSIGSAQTLYEEVIDGGVCLPEIPYNGANQTFTAINWQHWLYGFNGVAFCHLTMPNDWRVTNLSYVLFTGISNQGSQPAVLTAHLCVHSYDLAVSCGPAATISGGGTAPSYQINYVVPPSQIPPYSEGAFVRFDFPSNAVSTVNMLIPVWYK